MRLAADLRARLVASRLPLDALLSLADPRMTAPLDEEILLNRFRQWLHDARAEAEALVSQPLSDENDDEIGLYRLVEEFTALRHEVKLQTKGSRGLQEQAEALLPELRQAIEQFRAVEPRKAQAAWIAGKPLAEALADLDEALDRGPR